MAAQPPISSMMAVTAIDSEHAVIALRGELHVGMARQLEELLLEPRLHQAREWVLDMSDLIRLDIPCAYALRRAATRHPQTGKVTIRHASRQVQRTLRHAGVDDVATMNDQLEA